MRQILQNGQTHLNNLAAVAEELLSVFDNFVGLTLKGLKDCLVFSVKLQAIALLHDENINNIMRMPFVESLFTRRLQASLSMFVFMIYYRKVAGLSGLAIWECVKISIKLLNDAVTPNLKFCLGFSRLPAFS